MLSTMHSKVQYQGAQSNDAPLFNSVYKKRVIESIKLYRQSLLRIARNNQE